MSDVEQIKHIDLAGEMTIFRSEELKRTLLPIAEGQPALALDLSEVTEVDTAGIQLLLALKKTLEKRGGMIRLTAVSDSLKEALDLLGLEQSFTAWQTEK